MKPFLLLLLITSSVSLCSAQQHNTGCMHCKFSKSKKTTNQPKDRIAARASDECGCEACNKKEELERKARLAELKRREEATAMKNKAAMEAQQKKRQAEREAALAKNKSTEVLINNTPSAPATPKTASKTETTGPEKSLRFMGSLRSGFYDWETKKTIQRPGNTADHRPVNYTYGTKRLEGKNIAPYLHPAETGVINYYNNNPVKYCNGWGLNNWDIVDYNWNTLFNDESVHYIEHFYENWFLIGYLPCDKYEQEFSHTYLTQLKLYNVATKKYHEIPIQQPYYRLDLYGVATKGLYHSGQGVKVFHNPFYETGVYETDGKKHGSYELYYDKITGGGDGWKAAVPVSVLRSSSSAPNDSYTVIFLLDKSGNFKLMQADKEEYSNYFSRSAQ